MPLNKIIIILEKWLSSLTFNKSEISEYETLTKLCIFHNAFKFRENFYVQNDGLLLSPFLANLFMSELKIHITSSFPWMYESGNRYINNFFCIVKGNHLDNSLKLPVFQGKNVNFAMDIGNDNYLPFLDLRIIENNKKKEGERHLHDY